MTLVLLAFLAVFLLVTSFGLLLFYREGQSTRDVAALLGVSEPAVRKRLQRGRESLRASVPSDVLIAMPRHRLTDVPTNELERAVEGPRSIAPSIVVIGG